MILMVLVLGAIVGLATTAPEGDHVCPEEERYLVNVTRTVLRKVKIRNYKWCMNVPPRCSYYTEEEKHFPETVEEEDVRILNKCCPGYEEDVTGTTCISSCPPCVYGSCQLNNCICNPGYWGEICDTACPAARWGRNCEAECACAIADCDSVSGYCNYCPPGWKGSSCEEIVTAEDTATTSTTEIPTTTLQNVWKHLDQTVKMSSSSPTKYPTLQKYHTFFITTQEAPSSSATEESNTTKYFETSQIDAGAYDKEVDSIPVTQSSHDNLKATGGANFTKNEVLSNGQTEMEGGKEILIDHNQSPDSESHWVFSIGAVAGIAATLTLVLAVAISTAKNYRKNKKSPLVNGATKGKKENGGNGMQAVSIYARSVFHTPLPDPPSFENPVFTTPLDYQNHEFGGSLETQVICSMHLPSPNYRRDSRVLDAFYDYPPSTGSYRAASIPEPPEMALEKENLYDEIPCWTQSLPETPVTPAPDINLCPEDSFAFYANTMKKNIS